MSNADKTQQKSDKARKALYEALMANMESNINKTIEGLNLSINETKWLALRIKPTGMDYNHNPKYLKLHEIADAIGIGKKAVWSLEKRMRDNLAVSKILLDNEVPKRKPRGIPKKHLNKLNK